MRLVYFASLRLAAKPNRELQIRENGILKLHTNLEIFTSNPILKTHFFELGELRIFNKVIFYGALYAL